MIVIIIYFFFYKLVEDQKGNTLVITLLKSINIQGVINIHRTSSFMIRWAKQLN